MKITIYKHEKNNGEVYYSPYENSSPIRMTKERAIERAKELYLEDIKTTTPEEVEIEL